MGGLSWSLGGEREVDVLAHDPRAVGRWRWQNERALVKKKHCLKTPTSLYLAGRYFIS